MNANTKTKGPRITNIRHGSPRRLHNDGREDATGIHRPAKSYKTVPIRVHQRRTGAIS